MKLLYNRVAIKELQREQPKSSIALPESMQPKENYGEVIYIGIGMYSQTGELIPMQVKVGDRVLFDKSQVVETSINGERLLIMSEASVIGIL